MQEKQAGQLASKLSELVQKGEALLLEDNSPELQAAVDKLKDLQQQASSMADIMAAAKLFQESVQQLQTLGRKLERQIKLAKRKSVSGFMQTMRERAKNNDA